MFSWFSKIKTGLIGILAGISALLFFKSKKDKEDKEALEKEIVDLQNKYDKNVEASETLKENMEEAITLEQAIAKSNANVEDNKKVTTSKDDNYVVVNK